MELHQQLHLPAGLPQLQREHLVRVVGELLTNAHRHGAAGPVHLTIRAETGPSGEMVTAVTVENLLPAQGAGDSAGSHTAASRGGRGLAGLRERLELWGGTLEAGPRESTWQARALVPTLTERTEP